MRPAMWTGDCSPWGGLQLIRQVMPVAELMEELMGEAKETMKRLQGILDD